MNNKMMAVLNIFLETLATKNLILLPGAVYKRREEAAQKDNFFDCLGIKSEHKEGKSVENLKPFLIIGQWNGSNLQKQIM